MVLTGLELPEWREVLVEVLGVEALAFGRPIGAHPETIMAGLEAAHPSISFAVLVGDWIIVRMSDVDW